MAGGTGSRFWPISTPEMPKQFIDILGCGKSLIQLTVDRFKGIVPTSNIWVVTNQRYVSIVKQQLPEIDPDNILAEPIGRNTAPCIAWACWKIGQTDPEANIIVTPSDAFVLDTPEFQRVIKESLQFSNLYNAIVTIGIKPSRPETGYGYIHTVVDVQSPILRVVQFKEKPDRVTAEGYYADKSYLWNAGIFIWNQKTVETSIRKYKPELATLMDKILQTGDVSGLFPKCESISIDYAVMEPASADGNVYVHPADFGWSDLGNWASLHDKLANDSDGNASVGHIQFHECHDCICHLSPETEAVIHGLDGYIIAEHQGKILICKRSAEQRIKQFIR